MFVVANIVGSLQRQHGFQLALRQRATLHEDFAQLLLRLVITLDQLDVIFHARIRRHDRELDVVLHEFEYFFDRVLGGAAFVVDFKTEITGFRIHLVRRRHTLSQRGDVSDDTDGAEITQE